MTAPPRERENGAQLSRQEAAERRSPNRQQSERAKDHPMRDTVDPGTPRFSWAAASRHVGYTRRPPYIPREPSDWALHRNRASAAERLPVLDCGRHRDPDNWVHRRYCTGDDAA